MFKISSLATLSLLIPGWACANSALPPPSGSAGVVERQIQQEYETTEMPPEKEIPQIEIDEPKEQLRMPERQKIWIDHIEFEGNTVFSSEELKEAIEECTPSDCDMRDIREICRRVREKYIKAGYFLTRVYPPPQVVEEGILRLAIIEGKLGNVSVVGNKFYQTNFIESYFASLKDSPVNYDHIVRSLLLLNENTDMHAGAVFKKGEKQGTCDMIIRVNDARPAHLYLNTNTYGSRLNSRLRSGGRFDLGNLMMDGDKLTFTGVLGSPIRQLRFGDVHYNFLVSRAQGIRLDLSFLYSDFKDPVIPHLHLKGRSEIGSIQLSVPHLRTRRLNTDFYVAFDVKKIQNMAAHQTFSLDKLRIARLGLNIDYLDGIYGRNIWDVWYYQGIPNFLDGSGVVSSKPSRAGAGSRFSIGSLSYKRLQQIPWSTFIYINFLGQYTPNKLPTAQQIYIGGIDTVRGYPVAAGLGDYGYFVNFELRIPPYGLASRKVPGMKRTWAEFLQFIGFVDHGQTFLNGKSPGEIHHVHMTSAGVGARLHGPYGFDINFDMGYPLSRQKRSSEAITYFKVTWNPF